jgi:hypothetical protein
MPLTQPTLVGLLKQLQQDFPQYAFLEGVNFSWSPSAGTITYIQNRATPHGGASLLHELAHAELKHIGYTLDVALLRRESAAWHYAITILAPRYRLQIDQDFAEQCLDGYREWLYKRSTCPRCGQTGLQSPKKTYSCLNCRSSWRVNDARQCALRRIRLRGQS